MHKKGPLNLDISSAFYNADLLKISWNPVWLFPLMIYYLKCISMIVQMICSRKYSCLCSLIQQFDCWIFNFYKRITDLRYLWKIYHAIEKLSKLFSVITALKILGSFPQNMVKFFITQACELEITVKTISKTNFFLESFSNFQ